MDQSRNFIGAKTLAFGVTATITLVAISILGIRLARGSQRLGFGSDSSCAEPDLPGTVVRVALTNMGGPMMGQRGGMMPGGAMSLTADHAITTHGAVSFLATNYGSITHELVVLPLTDSQRAGARKIGTDGQVDEATSLGEASKSCGEGAGEGITIGSSSWLTLTLPPGRYELVCNLPGHYAAGMYTEFTVT